MFSKRSVNMKNTVYEPKTVADVKENGDQILKDIEQSVQKIRDKLQDHFHSEFRKAEIQQLSTGLAETLSCVSAAKAEDVASTEELATKIESCFGALNVDLKENVRKIRSYDLKTANDAAHPIGDSLFKLWRSYFYNSIEHLEKWVTFVNSVYGSLSDYEIQKNPNIIDDWGVKRSEKGIAVVDFGVFLEKIKQHGVELNNFKPDESDLGLLNDALSSVVSHETEQSCEENRLTVKGDFIKLSDVKKEIDACAKEEVQVFAFNRIFIDDDLDKTGSKLKLSIVAPTWQVIGDRKLILNGQNGKDPDQPHANDGQDGAPGLPGGQAGAFFGLNREILDGEKLSVSSIGGTGGRGQDGGDIHGETPSDDPNHYRTTFRCGEWPEPCNNHDGVPDTGKDGFSCHGYCSELDGRRARCNFSLYGKKSDPPKSGGRGGLPGKGGEIQIFGGTSKVNLVSANGVDGAVGKGGRGIAGDKIIVDCFRDGDNTNDWKAYHDKNYTPELTTGKDGDNEKDRVQPSESIRIDDKPGVVNKYKIALRTSYGDRFKRNILRQFHDLLDGNSEIKSLYRTLDLAEELKGLEDQLIKGELTKEHLIYFYDCLLEKISEYVKKPNENEKSDEYKKALSYVYTSALSKKHNLQTDSDSNLIIDINGHLDLVVQDMHVLKDLQKDRDKEKEMDNKLKVINKLKKAYRDGIDSKVQEASELIEKQMRPQLDLISQQIDQQLNKLIVEILKLEKDAKRDEEALEKKRAEMKRAMKLHAIFGALGFLGNVVGAIFPPAAIIGKAIDAGSSIAEGFLSGGGENELPQGLEDDIANLDKKLKILREKNTEQLSQTLDEILGELKKFEKDESSMDLKDLSDQVQKVKEKLTTSYNNREVLALIKDLKEVLKKKQDELRPKKARFAESAPSSKLTKALDLVKKAGEKLEKAGKAVEMGLEVFKRYKDDNEKLKEIDRAIDQEQAKILKLRQFEDEIYDTIRPMLGKGGLADELNDVAKQLKTKSEVSLDIAKFKIIGKLKDIKLTLQQVTEGFEVNADMTRCIEKQEEAMTTMINIYDRIQNYQSEKKLANYIAAIASVSASRIAIGDQKLSDKVNELEIAIRSNMVLKEYETSTTALKQWTFPFASIYLSELKLPGQLESFDLNSLVAAAAKEIEVIKRKLLDYKTSIQHQDRYIHNGEFNSDYVSTKPFFVFKKGNYSELIADLFAGKEVSAKADILDSAHDKDAIKFNLINVNFKIGNNKTRQAELNEKLRGFLISATHLGNSFYRAGKKIYSISGQSQTIEYSFEKNKKTGEPLDQNYVYQKIKNGDLMLSPYTMWKLRLLNATETIPFADLAQFADQVDMELIGFGSYLAQDVDVSSLDIDEYYEADDTVKYEAKSAWGSLSFVEMFKGFAANLYGRFADRNAGLNRLAAVDMRNTVAGATFSSSYERGQLKLEAAGNQKDLVAGPIDAIGNLVLAQVAVGKLFGENKHLSNNGYLSPDQEFAVKTDELARNILPALEMSFENETFNG